MNGPEQQLWQGLPFSRSDSPVRCGHGFPPGTCLGAQPWTLTSDRFQEATAVRNGL